MLAPLRRALSRLAAERRARRRSSPATSPPSMCRAASTSSALPGIPTIRVFEALACGIPLVCAPWEDSEDLFRPGAGLSGGADGAEMTAPPARPARRSRAARRARRAAGSRRSARATPARHRVDELLAIVARLRDPAGDRLHEDRLLRIEPAVLLLERRGHLLPRHAARRSPALGHDITFYEPDAFDRQQHRDIEPPDWAEVRGLSGDRGRRCARVLAEAARADVVVKASGVGVFDDELLEGVMRGRAAGRDPHLLGRRRAGDAGRDARRRRPSAARARCPRSTWC